MHFWCQGDPTPAQHLDRLIWANSVGLCNTWLDVIVVESRNLPNTDVVFHPVPPAAFQTLLVFLLWNCWLLDFPWISISLNYSKWQICLYKACSRWSDSLSLSCRCSVYGKLWAQHKWIPVFHLHCKNRMVCWWRDDLIIIHPKCFPFYESDVPDILFF